MESYTKENLLEKLSAGRLTENESVEFKEKWWQESGKNLSAIGNKKLGGWLIVRVDDKGSLINKELDWINKQKALIENHITQYLSPNSAVQSISVESINEKSCILVEIRSPNSIVFWNEKPYKRVGSNTKEKQHLVYALCAQVLAP